jgi:5-hydroxyisourate hydrolase-like protein (transthyretin family)
MLVTGAGVTAGAQSEPRSASAAQAIGPAAQNLPWDPSGPQFASGLDGLSCWAPGTCMAVGEITSVVSEPAAARLSDGNWTSKILPTTKSIAYGEMVAVDCTSDTFCVAVGPQYSHAGETVGPVVEVLAGTTWTAAQLYAPAGDKALRLNSISCPVEGRCYAAGSYFDASKNIEAPIVETLSGGIWRARFPPVGAHADAELFSVDCLHVGVCVAVGQASNGNPLVETISASRRWLRSSAPKPSDAVETRLTSVSCPDAEHCTAVGWFRNQSAVYEPVAESWALGAWSASLIPAPGGGFDEQENFSVSCASGDSCTAAGATYYGAFASTLAAGQWSTAAALPAPDSGSDTRIGAISCQASDACVAVGRAQFGNQFAIDETLATGTWTPDVVPMTGPPFTDIQAIDCVSATDCISVGRFSKTVNTSEAFSEIRHEGQWTGSVIDEVTDPFPEFTGISCATANWCLAIFKGDNGQLHAAELADGVWSVLDLPLDINLLQSVSAPQCPTVSHCTVLVSYTPNAPADHVVALTFDAGTWTSTPLPMPDGGNAVYRFTLSCATASWCAATGTYSAPGGGGLLAETLTNGTWTVDTLPDFTVAPASIIVALSCPAVGSCTGVGQNANDVSEVWQPLIITLANRTWHAMAPHLPANAWNESLSSVSCVSPGACETVGTFTNHARTAAHPLVGTVVGKSWAPVVVGNASDVHNAVLTAVDCPTAGRCWAVGDSVKTDGGQHPIAVKLSPNFVPPSALTAGPAQRIAAGASLILSTRLTDLSTGKPIAGARVSLWHRIGHAGSWRRVGTDTTAVHGRAQLTVAPRASGDYQWRFAGSAKHRATRSAVQPVRVHGAA